MAILSDVPLRQRPRGTTSAGPKCFSRTGSILVAGIGPLPRPQRFYFRFDKPIETGRWAGRANDQAACLELRAEVTRAIQRSITFLRRLRRRDPEAVLAARVARQFAPGRRRPLAPAESRRSKKGD